MNDVYIFKLFTRFSDMTMELEKRTNMLRHSSMFVPFLGIEFLIIIMDIDALTLSDMDHIETVPHVFREGNGILYMFSLAKLDGTSHQTHGCRVRSQPVKVVSFGDNPVLVLGGGSDEWLVISPKRVSQRGFWRTVF